MVISNQRLKPPLSPAEAEALLRAAGYEPLAPYPGSRTYGWPSRCVACGTDRRPSIQNVEQGLRCKHGAKRERVPVVDPVGEMNAAGYEVLEPYPGRVTAPWRVRCVQCGSACTPRLGEIRKGGRCAHSRATPEQALTELRSAGYEPLEPYPGRVRMAWKARCVTCGRKCFPSLSTLRQGLTCRHSKRRQSQ